jgi:hypothetical protein
MALKQQQAITMRRCTSPTKTAEEKDYRKKQTLTNNSTTDITVIARVNAVSGIVSIPTPNQTIMVPSGASAQVTVPMISVANGKTSLRATLTTTSGIVISDPVFIEIEVQAEWESITLVAFIAIIASIMGIGIARTIRDRRRSS